MRNMRQLERQGRVVRDEAIKKTVHAGLEWIVKNSPVDTARYIRAVAQAGNSAEAGPLYEMPVRDSKRKDDYIDRLVMWLEGAKAAEEAAQGKLDFLYPHGPPLKPRRSSLYASLVRKRDKAASDVSRATEQMEKATSNTGVLFFGSLWGNTRSGRSRPTVRTAIYGGTGSFVSSGTQAKCTLLIKEPHARFVETKHKLFSKASAVMRKFGVGRFPRDVAAIAIGAGFKVGKLSVSGAVAKGGR